MRPELESPPMVAHAAAKMTDYHRDVVDEVRAAIAAHDLVIVGMAINPHPRRVRRALDAAGVPYHYLSYGSYLSRWHDRLAIKLWSGWPTFPQVFVKGQLLSGANSTIKLLEDGTLAQMLAS